MGKSGQCYEWKKKDYYVSCASSGGEESVPVEAEGEVPSATTTTTTVTTGISDNSDFPCLCVFDIDRTLTGKQEQTDDCPRNKLVDGVLDFAYGYGSLTLSALAVAGINTTFCGSCY